MKRHKYNREEIKKACLQILPTIPRFERYAYNIFIRIHSEGRVKTDHTNVYRALKVLIEEDKLISQKIPWAGSGRFRHLEIYLLPNEEKECTSPMP